MTGQTVRWHGPSEAVGGPASAGEKPTGVYLARAGLADRSD